MTSPTTDSALPTNDAVSMLPCTTWQFPATHCPDCTHDIGEIFRLDTEAFLNHMTTISLEAATKGVNYYQGAEDFNADSDDFNNFRTRKAVLGASFECRGKYGGRSNEDWKWARKYLISPARALLRAECTQPGASRSEADGAAIQEASERFADATLFCVKGRWRTLEQYCLDVLKGSYLTGDGSGSLPILR